MGLSWLKNKCSDEKYYEEYATEQKTATNKSRSIHSLCNMNGQANLGFKVSNEGSGPPEPAIKNI